MERLAKRDCDQTGFQPVTWNRNANGLFACKWLRAPATNRIRGLRRFVVAFFVLWLPLRSAC